MLIRIRHCVPTPHRLLSRPSSFFDLSSVVSFVFTTKMSAKHLTKGSPLPPFNGILRVYSMRFCPYAQRLILVLNAKNVPYEVVNINLTEKPEWLTTKSPLGKVPALEIEENVVLYESLVTADYVDDKYPNKPLTSKDPLRKAQDKLIIENFSKVTTAYYEVLFKKEYNSEVFMGGLKEVQNHLQSRSTKFLAGDSPGMVDYMIWPWFERFELLPLYGGNDFKIDKNRLSTLISWIEAMKQDHAVKKHFLDPEIHNKFFKSRFDGINEYDFLL